MKRIVTLVLISFSLMTMQLTNAQVGINTVSPADGSMLDLSIDEKGILIPRIDISNLATINPISGGSTESLLVYNTNTTTGKGFHYWSGSTWEKIALDWKLIGDSGTIPGASVGENYFGTSDNEDLVFATNGDEQMRLKANGFWGINTIAAEEFLDVNGNIALGGGSTGYDGQGENIKFEARSEEWWIEAENETTAAASTFYFGTSQNPDSAKFLIENNGFVNIGADNFQFDDTQDMLHVTDDSETNTATIRIDNTRAANDIIHSSLELWQDSSASTDEKAFFRHNNNTNELEIGHARGNGKINFFAGNGGTNSGSSEIVAVIDENGNMGIGNDDTDPDALLHVTKDQNVRTNVRIDNTRNGTNVTHTALELYDGDTEMAFFRHNNNTDVLDLGHARGDGQVNLYSGDDGDASGESDLTMTLENDGSVTIEKLMNLKPGFAPSSPQRGDIYYRTGVNKLRVYTGSVWEDLN